MVSKGKDYSVHSAVQLKKLMVKREEMITTHSDNQEAKQIIEMVGIASDECKKYFSTVADSTVQCLRKMQHNATVKVKKTVSDATTLLSNVPDVAVQESAYRTKMKSMSSKLAVAQDSIEKSLAFGVAAFELEETPFRVQEKDTVTQADGLLVQCLFHVCLFAALSLFRDPKFGTAEGNDNFKKFKIVMDTLKPLENTSNFGAELLQDMDAATEAPAAAKKAIIVNYFRQNA
jgi:hypothetical protein